MKNKKQVIRLLTLILICVIFFFVIVAAFYVVSMHKQDLIEEAKYKGLYSTTKVKDLYDIDLDEMKKKATKIKEEVDAQEFSSEEEFITYFGHDVFGKAENGIGIARYFKGDKEYRSNGLEFTGIEHEMVKKYKNYRSIMCLGVINDHDISLTFVTYLIPLKDTTYADTLVLFFNREAVIPDSHETVLDNPKSELTVVTSNEGEIVSYYENSILPDSDSYLHANILEKLMPIINDDPELQILSQAMKNGRDISYQFKYNGKDYILSLSSILDNSAPIFGVYTIYALENIQSVGTEMTEVLAILIVIVSFLSIGFMVMSYFTKKRIKETIFDENATANLDFANETKFVKTATEILERNPSSKFAVIVANIKHYDYLYEQIGNEAISDGLKAIKTMLDKCMQLEETLGYLGNGRFIMLIHYRDEEMLAERLKDFNFIGQSVYFKGEKNFTTSLYGGIYPTEKKITPNVSKMIELAISAQKANEYEYDYYEFRIYNESIYQSSVLNDYIELNMEKALVNHDYKVFYQPKQNIGTEGIDGAEALVRWYNPEIDDYMVPGIFIPLFESNKFIIQLDHYVFEEVLKFIVDARENNISICPISVNVSRITASQQDFADYYIQLKDKYQVGKNIIMIEFTESFAYEDYFRLRDIITKLHQHGFKCSIDDFGSGFSSYNILKELPMDEIKLDRFFVKTGFSKDRDQMVLKSVIELGKELHMKVTQEGVENIDQFNNLKKLGCHVIQGYLYSKPLTLPDFISFLEKKNVIKKDKDD